MAQLIVRNLDDNVRDKIRDRAQSHGRSMEEEVRDILRAAVVAETDVSGLPGLGTRISNRFDNCHLPEDFEIPEWRGFEPRPASFQ